MRASDIPPRIKEGASGVARETASFAINTIIVRDWLGRQVRQGEVYFSDASTVTRASLSNGSAPNPAFDWTHVLVMIPNHAYRVVPRASTKAEGTTGTIQMPAPNFLARIHVDEPPPAGVKLVVDFPWIETEDWPRPLREGITIPQELRLHIDPITETTFFVSASDQPITVTCGNEMLIVTPEGLAKTVEYPPLPTEQQIALRRYPVLAVDLQPTTDAFLWMACRVSVTLKESGLHDHETSRLVDVHNQVEWGLPYDPAYATASIVVRGRVDGLQLGRAEVKLTGSDQTAMIELRQELLSITVLDSHGFGIPDVVIVQAGTTLATTDTTGSAQVALNKDAGRLWFLSRPHDASSVLPERLLADPIVHLEPATGLAIQCRSSEQASMLAATGRLEVHGLTYSAALWEAGSQTHQVYGLRVVYSELAAMDFGEIFGMDSGSEVEVVGSSFVFQLSPSPWDPLQLHLAGVFEVEDELQAHLECTDGFEQEAWREPIPIFPHEVSVLDLSQEESFETIAIRVVDATGNPLKGADVSAGPWAGFLSLNPTGSDGRATLRVSRKADTILLVEAVGFVSQRVAWPLPAGADLVQLDRARQLRIQVLDPSGNRLDADLFLTDGISRWHGGSGSKGIFQFTGIPRETLVAKIVHGGSEREYQVPSEVEILSIILSP